MERRCGVLKMSCLPCDEDVNISKEDFDRWTDHLQHVLSSPRARRKFGEFLNTRSLDEAENTLEFWGRCNKFITDAKQLKGNPSGGVHMKFHKEATSLVEFAEENVNFDVSELRYMHQELQKGKAQNIINMIERAMHSSAQLLKDEYNLFRSVLLKDKGVIFKKS